MSRRPISLSLLAAAAIALPVGGVSLVVVDAAAAKKHHKHHKKHHHHKKHKKGGGGAKATSCAGFLNGADNPSFTSGVFNCNGSFGSFTFSTTDSIQPGTFGAADVDTGHQFSCSSSGTNQYTCTVPSGTTGAQIRYEPTGPCPANFAASVTVRGKPYSLDAACGG